MESLYRNRAKSARTGVKVNAVLFWIYVVLALVNLAAFGSAVSKGSDFWWVNLIVSAGMVFCAVSARRTMATQRRTADTWDRVADAEAETTAIWGAHYLASCR